MEKNSSNTIMRTIVHNASGSRCQVHDLGATILSFRPGGNRECLFLSRDAVLDGTKAIRGGIPLVFPQFGPLPDSSMPQHGFLRKNAWKFHKTLHETEESVCVEYTLNLEDVVHARGTKDWAGKSPSLDCNCSYIILMTATTLTTTLTITNTSLDGVSFPFQTLQHTYLQVDNHAAYDPSQCYVEGLKDYTVEDKVTNVEEYVCKDDKVVLDGNVDRVYHNASDGNIVDVTVSVGSGNFIRLKAYGTISDKNYDDNTTTNISVSCVVWNPHKEKAEAMSDFGSDQYVDMICVEPGVLQTSTHLAPGEKTSLTQVLELLSEK